MSLLQVDSLTVGYSRGLSHRIDKIAARDIHFTLEAGHTLGLIGESGAGKSSVLRAIMGLIQPQGGRICFEGKDIAQMNRAEERLLRQQMAMLFQSPAVNPKMRVRDIIAEPLRNMRAFSKGEIALRVDALLDAVNLPRLKAGAYPHELSGGQLRRVSMARALALRPKLLLADEPISGLDAPIQTLILDLLADLQRSFGLSLLLVTHDLGVARRMCDQLCVMRQGEIVERGATQAILASPQHAYTRALMDAELGIEP
ncbi:MAG: ATP-binding cassette domain-containing protein [Oscillospiraceae bacterium]|jgi:ABC-type glutathione transport system ATPase component|nr:ATP-binding cassette domain-containing protein [Oscillospiraceae bacterium]